MLPDNTTAFIIATLYVVSMHVVLPDGKINPRETRDMLGLNAPTGAWCSLTPDYEMSTMSIDLSQCTYRCVVLPDAAISSPPVWPPRVSMHLQVRGAP